MRRFKRICQHKNGRHYGKQQRKYIFNKEKACGALYIINDPPSLGNDFRHMRKIRVHKNDLRDLRDRLAARRHGNTAIGILHSKNIVNTVARHSNGMALRLKSQNKLLFLLRSNSAENREMRGSPIQLFIGIKGSRINIILGIFNTGKPRYLRNGFGMVSGYNLYIDTLIAEIAEGSFSSASDSV